MRDDIYVRREDTTNCWYKDFCENFNTDNCVCSCKKFTQTDYLFQLSNLPKSLWKPIKIDSSYLDTSVEEILNTIISDCEFFVKKGFNLYLYGDTGVGKTSWAVKIMNNYFASIAEQNNFQTRGLYVNVPSFLRDSKLYMTYKSSTYMEFLKTIQTCDIVIWDDIGQTDPTKYESQWLYSYINDRTFAKKCNIVTSNLAPDQLESLDYRLYSRVCEGADCLKIDGIDFRYKNTYTNFMNSEVVDDGSASNY